MDALKDMYRGDSRILHISVPLDMTGGHLYFIVKAKDTDTDDLALVDKEWVLDAPLASGEFIGQTRGATVEITPQEASLFPVGSVFVGTEFLSALGRNRVIYNGSMGVLRDLRFKVGA